MPSQVHQVFLDRQRVVKTPLVNRLDAAHALFIIAGGPVWIKAFFMHTVGAQATGTTITVSCNNILWDNGAFNFDCLAGTFWVWSLVTGAGPVPVNAAMTPMPTTAALALNEGVLASHDAAVIQIVGTTAGGFGGTVNAIEFFVLYHGLTPEARIYTP